MKDLLTPELTLQEVNAVSSLGLAHVGDAVYSLLVRTMLLEAGNVRGDSLHQDSAKLVCAPAQARAAERLLPHLTEEEAGFFRRGRNADVRHIPKNASHAQYSRATGLEALFGALYLMGRRHRLMELFTIIMEDEDAA